METIIEFRHINKRFPGVQALSDINFSVLRGEVHALVGENGAGKSTLMNILAGEFPPDEGEVIFKGKPVRLASPHAAAEAGISVVHQELKLCPNLSAVENMFLGREKKTPLNRLDWPAMKVNFREIMEAFGVSMAPDAKTENLSVAHQQLVEIGRAIQRQAEVLIMDEPTSALAYMETEKLFSILAALKAKGTTIIYISHRLEEVFRISDRISVLRDGRHLGTFEIGRITHDEVVNLIAGRELASEMSRRKKTVATRQTAALEVRGLSRGRYFQDIGFKLYEGEVLGIYGLQGAGRTELLETLFGLERADSGEMFVYGRKIIVRTPQDAIRAGLAMVPEDRKKSALFANMDVKDNIGIAHADAISMFGFLRQTKMAELAMRMIAELKIKVDRIAQMAVNLSGGNQQKTIIARWLALSPKILLVDELTRGIDVGAKAEIYRVLQSLREKGLSVVLVSSELSEVLAESDRLLVMRNGRLVAELTQDNWSKEIVLRYALEGSISNN